MAIEKFTPLKNKSFLTGFTTRKERTVDIIEHRLDLLDEILEFVNELGEEDTF